MFSIKSVPIGKTLALEGMIIFTYTGMITSDVVFQIMQLSK
jgi:hypothetical protein